MSHGRKVLVIDDEKVVCSSCQRVLEEEGFDVSVATDGRKGVEKLSRETFDVVIVDLRMPGIGGMDVLRIIKRKKPDIRVLTITAYSSIATAVEAMQLGAADYLPKPFTPRELSYRVNRVFRDARAPSGAVGVSAPPGGAVLKGIEDREGVPAEARILLAGSDTEEMRALGQCLSSEPWEIRIVEKHDEIIELIRAGQVDVLITGLDVLGMSAYELIPEVKKLGSDIPIIVACADPSLDLARRVREFGIFFYLMEPFDPEEVKAAVRAAVRKALTRQREMPLTPSRTALVRCVRTVGRDGRKVGFVGIGECMGEKSALYREITGELKRRGMPIETELARNAVSAKELPRYLEQDDRVVIVAASEADTGSDDAVSYSAEEFEENATQEQRRKLREVGYPEVLDWMRALGIAPEVRMVFLPGERRGSDQAGKAGSIIVNEGLA